MAADVEVLIRRIVHIIPVGGKEPLHTATQCCHCQPLVNLHEGTATHHAWDLREKWNRQNFHVQGTAWVLVLELEVVR